MFALNFIVLPDFPKTKIVQLCIETFITSLAIWNKISTQDTSPPPAAMATNSERQIGETLTDSLLIDIMTPGYLPDISALQVPTGTYQGKHTT